MNILRWRIYVRQESGDYEDCGLLFASYEAAHDHAKNNFDDAYYRIVMTEIKQ